MVSSFHVETCPPGARRFRAAAVTAVCWLLALAPFWILAARVKQCAVNVPFMDDWQFVPLCAKAAEGKVGLSDLFAPHDEHRLFLPRVAIIATVLVCREPYVAQCYLTLAVALTTSLGILYTLGRVRGWGRGTAGLWFLVNLCLFTPLQYHNWLWPMQFAYLMPFMFFALATAIWMSGWTYRWRWIGAAICALAASFSFVNGLLLWPAMLPLLAHRREGERGAPARRGRWVWAWLGLGVAVAAVYFAGLQHNTALPIYAYGHKGVAPTASTLEMLRADPWDGLRRMGLFIAGMYGNALGRGFPVSDNLIFCRWIGVLVAGLAIGGWIAVVRGRLWPRGMARLAGGWAILAFVAATVVSVGRTSLAINQPLTPRYMTYGTYCVAALVLLLAAAFAPRAGKEETAGGAPAPSFGLVLATLFVGLQFTGWVYGWQLMEDWAHARRVSLAGLRFLRHLDIAEARGAAGVTPEVARESLDLLDRLRRPIVPPSQALSLEGFEVLELSQMAKKGSFSCSGRTPDGHIGFEGRAVTHGHEPAEMVFLCAGAPDEPRPAIVGFVVPGKWPLYTLNSQRKDFEFTNSQLLSDADYGRWHHLLPATVLDGREGQSITAWAFDQRKNRVFRLGSPLPVDGLRSLPVPARLPEYLHPTKP